MFVEGGGTRKKFLKPGEILFREGDPGDAAFIVDSGKIGIFKIVEGEEVELAALSPGELFGEMAIVDGTKRMANAVAKEETVIIEIPAAVLGPKLAKADPFIRALTKILVNNLRNVHRAYMRRARSVRDYTNAIEYHTQGFRMYLTRLPESDQTSKGLEQLDRMDAAIDELRRLFNDHPDRRHSVLGETDVTREKGN